MNDDDLNKTGNQQKDIDRKKEYQLEGDQILCKHCKRTLNNGIRCLGMCVADNEY